jgi:phosphoenolpyruvate---glycerone phosphotransferase subunit DhaL
MGQLINNDIKKIFLEIKTIMDEHKDYLCELDAALGDGDIGLTLTKGFKAIVEETEQLNVSDLGLLFKKSGFVLAETVPSTMGTLLASAFMQAGNELKGKEAMELSDIIIFFSGMIEGIRKRGKAEVGDKTILDSLHPALESLKESAEKGLSLAESLTLANISAFNGAENTKNLQSKHGRAERYFENSIGHQDPGATVGALIVKGFDVYLN